MSLEVDGTHRSAEQGFTLPSTDGMGGLGTKRRHLIQRSLLLIQGSLLGCFLHLLGPTGIRLHGDVEFTPGKQRLRVA